MHNLDIISHIIEKFMSGTFIKYEEEKGDYSVVFHRSICFSVDDLLCLITNMDKCKDKLFVRDTMKFLQITFEKLLLDSKKEILEEIKNSEEYEMKRIEKKKNEKRGRKILYFFYLIIY